MARVTTLARKKRGVRTKSGEEEEMGRADLRRRQLLTESARLFARQGFDGTSMRDIAAASGVMAGSLYYHFASKDEIFVAVHGRGMEMIEAAVREALEGITDPWERLEVCAAAHLESLINSDFRAIITPTFPQSLKRMWPTLIKQRDSYETLVKQLVTDLNLPVGIDLTVFRLHFLGALNWTPTWFKSNGGMKLGEVARQLVRTMRGAQH